MAKIMTKRNGTIELETIVNKDGGEFIPHQELSRYIYDEMFGQVSVDTQLVSTGSGVLATCKMTDVETGRSVVGVGESVPTPMESDYEKGHRAFSAANRAFDNAAFLFLGIDRSTLAKADAPQHEAPATEPAQAPASAPAKPAEQQNDRGTSLKQTIDENAPFDTVIVSGKFKGKTFREAAQENPGYAQWVIEKSKMPQEIKDIFSALLQG